MEPYPTTSEHPLSSIRPFLEDWLHLRKAKENLQLLYRLFSIYGYLKQMELKETTRFVVLPRSPERIRLQYRQQYALDIRLLSCDFFMLSDGSLEEEDGDDAGDDYERHDHLGTSTGGPAPSATNKSPASSPYHHRSIPHWSTLVYTITATLEKQFEKHRVRNEEEARFLSPWDKKLRVMVTPGMTLVGNLGADCWVLREALARMLQAIQDIKH